MSNWDTFTTAVTAVVEARAALDAALARAVLLEAWPWRISKQGNLVRSNGEIVLRGGPGNRSERRRRLRPLLAQLRGDVELRFEELVEAQQAYELVRPAEPGQVFGVDVPDVTRMTAAQIAEAANRSSMATHCRFEYHPRGVRITFGAP